MLVEALVAVSVPVLVLVQVLVSVQVLVREAAVSAPGVVLVHRKHSPKEDNKELVRYSLIGSSCQARWVRLSGSS
jgi:hypothetical protein